jgi:hypothetical protein
MLRMLASQRATRGSKLNKFDAARPCLVLAPHLEYPLRNGADLLIDRKWSCFSRHVPFVDIIGREVVSRYRDGQLVSRTPYENIRISKARAGVSTLIRRSHYLMEKHLTKDFGKIADLYLSDAMYKTVVFSPIWTASIKGDSLDAGDRLCCIETHNDEFKWFSNLRRSSINPLAKLTAYSSERWVRSFLNQHHSEFLFLHVSRADQQGYVERIPNHRSCVVPIGVDEIPTETHLQADQIWSHKVRLIFVGSLGVKINVDAISTFERKFYPLLEEHLRDNLEVLVVGSNPSKKITRICRRMGWKLYANVTDQQLRYLYCISTFSILPFPYATGSKLKLLDSLAHGTPYLATSVLRDQGHEPVYPCLISSDPEQWLHRISEVRKRGITDEDRRALRGYANEHSWTAIADHMFQLLTNCAV